MSNNQETQNVPRIVPTVSSFIETPVIKLTLPVPTSPNPNLESQPPFASSPTQSSSGSYRSRKPSTPKKFVAVTSTSASLEKIVEEDTVEGEENQEISSLPVEESSKIQQGMGRNNGKSTRTTPGVDLYVADSTGNAFPMSSEFTLGLQEQEA